jgi:hypothetical protein
VAEVGSYSAGEKGRSVFMGCESMRQWRSPTTMARFNQVDDYQNYRRKNDTCLKYQEACA